VVGYFRPVSQWNKGKYEEFGDRKSFVPELKERHPGVEDDSRYQGYFSDRLSGEGSGGVIHEPLQLPLPILS
jgi:hypothetical protein